MGKRLRVLIVVISVAATMLVVPSVGQLVASGSAGAAAADTQQFTGRDIYAPDIIPNPNGQGYVMWYGGWQTQQAVNAGQLDTIFQRTSPTPNGPWSNPTTDILSSQVAAAASEVNDPSVSVVSVGTSYLYTMFFTVLSCGERYAEFSISLTIYASWTVLLKSRGRAGPPTWSHCSQTLGTECSM